MEMQVDVSAAQGEESDLAYIPSSPVVAEGDDVATHRLRQWSLSPWQQPNNLFSTYRYFPFL